MVVPLRVRGTVIGDIALVAAESGRHYGAGGPRARAGSPTAARWRSTTRACSPRCASRRRPRRDARRRRRRGHGPGRRTTSWSTPTRPPSAYSAPRRRGALRPRRAAPARATRCSPRTGGRWTYDALPGRLALAGERPTADDGPLRRASSAARSAGRGSSPPPVHDPDGGVRLAINVIEDITEDSSAPSRRSGSWPRRAACSRGSLDCEVTLAHGRPAGGAGDRRLVRASTSRPATASSASRSHTSTRRGSRWRASAGALSAPTADQHRRLRGAATRDRRAVSGDHRRDARGGRARRGAPARSSARSACARRCSCRCAARPRARRDLVRVVRVGPPVRRADLLARRGPRRCAPRAAVENARLYETALAIARDAADVAAPARAAGRSRRPDWPPPTAGRRRASRSAATSTTSSRPREDQWYVVIGDVCGKGAEAAAVTALARYTLRAAAVRRRSPSAILRWLSDAMLDQADDGRALLHDRLRPASTSARSPARLTVACGGHPLPLRACAPTGRVEARRRPGTLLGLVEHPELSRQPGRAAPRRHARPLHRRADRGAARHQLVWTPRRSPTTVRAPRHAAGRRRREPLASDARQRAVAARRRRGARTRAD